MKNEYEVRGDVTVIFIDSPKHGRFETIIDTDDLELVSNTFQGNLTINVYRNVFRVQGRMSNGEKIGISRLLMGFPGKGFKVDHIDGSPLNNSWLKNLRILTHLENIQNRTSLNKNNKSGFRGVAWYAPTSRWMAGIYINYKRIHLGYFKELEEAARVVKEARESYGFKSNSIR